MATIPIPATGSAIAMGKVYRAYTNIIPTAGTNVQLRATLGAQIGVTTGQISLSSSFGGRINPPNFDYV